MDKRRSKRSSWLHAGLHCATIVAICTLGGAAGAGERDPQEARALLESVAKLQALVETNLVPHIDFEVASALVLGPHWQRASEKERDAFITEFRSFLTRFYTQALSGYLKAREVPNDVIVFEDEPLTKGDRQVLVPSLVRQPGGSDIPVVYRLLWVDSWKVIDVNLAGISMIRNYRASFSSTVANEGIEALITQLRTRNSSLGVSL